MKSMLSLAIVLAIGAVSADAQISASCCTVTAIESRTGVVSAKVTATGYVFAFRVTDTRMLAGIRVGQTVSANFTSKQASLDGRTLCCTITDGPRAPTAATGAAGVAQPPAGAGGVRPNVATIPGRAGISSALPTIAFGPPQKRTPTTRTAVPRFESHAVTTAVAGRTVTTTVLHLRGLKAIEQATGLNEDARRLLLMHVRTIPRDQSDHYIVNPQLAEQWVRDHPVPAYVKPAKEEKEDCNNFYDSIDCAGAAVSDEWKRALERATKAWDDVTGKLEDEWNAAQDCFAEKTLRLANIPIAFNISPMMTVSMEGGRARGSASGTARGSVGLGVPMDANFNATLDLFYVPCLPFVVRPKALSADGVMTVGETLTANVTTTGNFNKTFTIPPTGGPVIPIQVFPIVIGGVPVAELDVSAYIEGNIEVTAQGRAEGQFTLTNSNPTRFDFTCSGSGCRATSKGLPAPTTTSESAQLQGKVIVKPAIYTALQLDFNYQALSARAGPQPYLLGTASGCAAVAGTQTAGGASTTQENHALMADLDWGAELRAEALVLRKVVGSPFVVRMMDDKHIWFRDIAPGGSNALVAAVESPAQVQASKPAAYKVRMPSCYPYTELVEYRVTWTGGATPAPNARCQWQAGRERAELLRGAIC